MKKKLCGLKVRPTRTYKFTKQLTLSSTTGIMTQQR